MEFYEALGWLGSFCVILAYGLNSYQKLKSDSWIFYTMNLTGGIFLIIFSFYKEAYPNVFINVVWVLIALPGLFKVLTNRS